jgi:hypothetical protein
MPEHDLQTSYVNRGACRDCGHTTTRDSAQRSWRTIEAARRDAEALIIRARRKSLTDDGHRLDRDHGRKDAGEVGMQCAAGVSNAPITVMMGASLIPVMVRMMMIGMRSVRNRLRVGAWRRHHARELGHQKQGHQQTDKSRYGPEPIHLL